MTQLGSLYAEAAVWAAAADPAHPGYLYVSDGLQRWGYLDGMGPYLKDLADAAVPVATFRAAAALALHILSNPKKTRFTFLNVFVDVDRTLDEGVACYTRAMRYHVGEHGSNTLIGVVNECVRRTDHGMWYCEHGFFYIDGQYTITNPHPGFPAPAGAPGVDPGGARSPIRLADLVTPAARPPAKETRMKVDDSALKPNSATFEDLEGGDVFEFSGKYYLKFGCVPDGKVVRDSGGEVKYYAVRLANGEFRAFAGNCPVVPRGAELKILPAELPPA